MRRVGHGGSPEVVRVSESSPDSAETSFRELDDVFLQTQAKIWLGEVLHIRFDEETAIADLLADGELLFQVSKVVWKMLVKKYVELKHSKVYIHERTSSGKSDGRYMPYPKVDSFLKVCQILGLTGIDLFSPSDVVEKRDIRRVCLCVRSLSRKARLKNLIVPDFDIVTYTIAMPTNLVGGICRYLEQSQSSSASSNGYSPCMDSRELHEERRLSGYRSRQHDSCSGSGKAESSFNELKLQSPPSNASHDKANLFNVVERNSVEGNSGYEDASELPTGFQLDHQEYERRYKSWHCRETPLVESVDLPCVGADNHGHHDSIVALHSSSALSCSQCPTGQSAKTYSVHEDEIRWLSNWQKSDEQFHDVDVDCIQTCASCFEDFPHELDCQLPANVKEASKRCIDLLYCENCLLRTTAPDCYISPDNDKGEFAKSYTGGQDEKVYGTAGEDDLREKSLIDGHKHVFEPHERKPRCSNVSRFSDAEGIYMASEVRSNAEGQEDIGSNNIVKKHAGELVNINNSHGRSIVSQSSSSDVLVYSINNGNILISDPKMSGGLLGLNMENSDLNCINKKYKLKMNAVGLTEKEEAVDADIFPSTSLTATSDNITTKASENKYDSNDHDRSACCSSFPDAKCYEEIEQCNILDIPSKEHLGIAAEMVAMTTELQDMETYGDKSLLAPEQCGLSIETESTEGRSSPEIGTPDVPDSSVQLDCCKGDTEELKPFIKAEDTTATGFPSSITDKQHISLGNLNGILLCGDTVSQVESAFKNDELISADQFDGLCDSQAAQPAQKNHSVTCINLSDKCIGHEFKDALSPDVCLTSFRMSPAIQDSADVFTFDGKTDLNEQLNDSAAHRNEDTTTDGRSVRANETFNSTMVGQKHKAMASFNMDGVRSILFARDCNSRTERELNTKSVEHQDSRYHHPSEAYRDLVADMKNDNLPEKLHTENSSNWNFRVENTGFDISETVWCSSTLSGVVKEDGCCTRSSIVEDLCSPQMKPLSNGYEGSSQQTLPVEERSIMPTHSSVSSDMISTCYTNDSCQQQMQHIILDASDNTPLPLVNSILGTETSNCLQLDHIDRSETWELEIEATKLSANSEVPGTCYSDDHYSKESADHNNANLQVPGEAWASEMVSTCQPALHDGDASTSNRTHLEDDNMHPKKKLACAASGCSIDEAKQDICAEQSTEVKDGVLPLLDDVGAIVKHRKADDTEKRIKDMEDITKKSPAPPCSNEVHKPGKVLASVAGGITVIGALFAFLHLRRKGIKQRNIRTVAPSQKLSQEASPQKKTETSKSHALFPGERIKL